MSALAIADWYMATCVNAPSPVTSPTAQTLSVTRMWASARMQRAVESSPMVSIPSPSRLALRPVATSSRSAVIASPVASVSVIPRPFSDALAALALQNLGDRLPSFRLLRREQAVQRFHDSNRDSETCEDLAQLQADRTSSKHGQRGRQMVRLDGLVVGPVG